MACMAILLAASTVMQGHRAWYSSWPFNAQCVFEHYDFADVGGLPARWMYTKLVVIFIDYPSSIGLLYQPACDLWKQWLYTKPREAMQRAIDRLQQMRSRKAPESSATATAGRVSCSACIALVKNSRIVCSFTYMLITSIFASRWTNLLLCVGAFIYGLVGLFQDRNIPKEQMEGDENLMSFGQIVPILILCSTILVAREAYEGEYCGHDGQVAPLTMMIDVRIEMRNEDLGIGSTSVTDLLNGWSTGISAFPGGQNSNKSGDLQVLDNATSARPSPRRLDTEMGGRAHSSGRGGTHATLHRMRSAHASLSGSPTPQAGL